MSSNNNHMQDPLLQDEADRRARAEETLWQAVGTLFRWRRFIVGVTGAVAVLAVVLTLLMPNVYQASARLLLPESSGGFSAAMLKNLPSAASALLGGGGGDYLRYMAILDSRTVLEAAVDSFDLVQVYELEESDTPREDALQVFRSHVEFILDMEYNYLSVATRDTDPARAAALANFLVRKLNAVNTGLATQSARNYREFIERRYLEAEAAMDSVLDATQAFQQEYGVYDLPTQTQSFFEQIAALRTQALEAEIQYEVLQEQYGSQNPRVQTARDAARAANAKYQEALQGQELLLPVPQQSVPGVARRYAELEMERTIQVAILELIRPMYEQARLQEQQKLEAVQVLDHAVPPAQKSAPRRSVICIVATLSAFMLACLYALLMTWWHRHHATFAHRLRQAIAVAERDTTPISS